MMDRKKENIEIGQKGFSLIELIIVIAMVAILSSGAVIGISMLSNNDIKKVDVMVKGSLERTKTYCLGKQSASCMFYTEGDSLMCSIQVNGEEISKEKLAGNKVSIKYVIATEKKKYELTDTGVTEVGAIGSGKELVIEFDHSSGALKPKTSTTDQYLYTLFICKDDKNIIYDFSPRTGKFYIR